MWSEILQRQLEVLLFYMRVQTTMGRQTSAGNNSRIEIRDTFLAYPPNDALVNPSNEQIFNLSFASFNLEQKEEGGHSPAPLGHRAYRAQNSHDPRKTIPSRRDASHTR